MKHCHTCGQDKHRTEFNKGSARDGLQTRCRDCANAERRKRRAANPERYRAETRKWRQDNIDYARAYSRDRYRKYRYTALSYYSNGKMMCACCGESEVKFLTLDHIHGDGAEQRRISKIHDLGYWAYKNDYPEGLQVLCFNCNCSKGFYGECGHKFPTVTHLEPEQAFVARVHPQFKPREPKYRYIRVLNQSSTLDGSDAIAAVTSNEDNIAAEDLNQYDYTQEEPKEAVNS